MQGLGNLEVDEEVVEIRFKNNRKATIYYMAERSVDFHDLVRKFASAFQVKVVMRQIGIRHEARVV